MYYKEILDKLEIEFKVAFNMNEDINKITEILDLIVKIKTIQTMDILDELMKLGIHIIKDLK